MTNPTRVTTKEKLNKIYNENVLFFAKISLWKRLFIEIEQFVSSRWTIEPESLWGSRFVFTQRHLCDIHEVHFKYDNRFKHCFDEWEQLGVILLFGLYKTSIYSLFFYEKHSSETGQLWGKNCGLQPFTQVFIFSLIILIMIIISETTIPAAVTMLYHYAIF